MFALLAEERNLAADAALAYALPYLDRRAARAVLDLIVKRNRDQGLAPAVGGYQTYPKPVKDLILNRVDDLFGGVRVAIESGGVRSRLGAIALIEDSYECKLVYLLGSALKIPCTKTREIAAQALNRMVERHLSGLGNRPEQEHPTVVAVRASYLCEALHEGILAWETHYRPELLEAALWFADRLEPAIRQKLAEPKTKFAHAINSMIEGTNDPRLAGFVLRAVAIEPVRATAIQAITNTHDYEFIRALTSHSWLLTDEAIRHDCLRIRELQWLDDDANILLSLETHEVAAVIRLVSAAGIGHSRKIEIFRSVLALEEEVLARTIAWQLVMDKSPEATDLLAFITGHASGDAARIAARELRHRGINLPSQPHTAQLTDTSKTSMRQDPKDAGELWQRFWMMFEQLPLRQFEIVVEEMREMGVDLTSTVQSKLTSSNAPERARAIKIADRLEMIKDLSEVIYRLANDPDAVVRSQAVSLLAQLPGATSRRILQRAIEDPDERVQANAIDSLDEMEADGRQQWIEPKLESENNRVRANAIKALLKMEFASAGEILLDMLEGPSSTGRLSALWVVEHLNLESLLEHVGNLANDDTDSRVRKRALRVLNRLSQSLSKNVLHQVVQGAQP